MTENAVQWCFIIFLLLVCFRHALIIDRGQPAAPAEPANVTDEVLGPAFDVTFNHGKRDRPTVRLHAINEGDLVRVMLARGLDIHKVMYIKKVSHGA